MKYGIYAIKDAVSGFLTPTLDQSDNSAMRNFHHATSKTESLMYFKSSDFDLYKLGEFDTESGEIIPFPTPKFVAHAYNAETRLHE